MTNEVTGILVAGLGFTEVAAYSLAALLLLRYWGYTLAEAAAGAALTPAMLAIFLLRCSHLAGTPALAPAMRVIAMMLAAILIGRHRGRIPAAWRALGRFGRDHFLAAGVLLGALLALAVAAVLSGGQAMPPRQAPIPISYSGFPGAALMPWMAYLTICFATYALARRYAWPPTAITVTLLVVSMPRLVFLCVSGPGEIIPAAAALVFILLLYRTVERPDIKDLLLLAVVMVFSLSAGRMGLIFAILGTGLAVVVLHRRHGGRTWWELARSAPFSVAAAGLAVWIFAQGWHWSDWPYPAGDPTDVWRYNSDGLAGAGANLFRYALQVLDLTPPVEALLAKVFNLDWSRLRMALHDFLMTVFSQPAETGPSFMLPAAGNRNLAWFGPFAGLLVLPAMGWALWRGPRRLKSLALCLTAYGALVALIPAWSPGNVRFFTVFFVCAGFTTAFLLPPWRMTRRRRRILQVSATALMVYAVGVVCRGL